MDKLRFTEYFFNYTKIINGNIVLPNYLKMYYDLHKKSFSKFKTDSDNINLYLVWCFLNRDKKIIGSIKQDLLALNYLAQPSPDMPIFNESINLLNFDKYYFYLHESEFRNWSLSIDEKSGREKYAIWLCSYSGERENLLKLISPKISRDDVGLFVKHKIKLSYQNLCFYYEHCSFFEKAGIYLNSTSGYQDFYKWLVSNGMINVKV